MADVKISALPASTTPLAGTEVLPIVQGTTTKQVSVANLTAGRAVSALSLTATNDSSISGLTIGKGVGAVATNTALGASVLSNASLTGGANTGVGGSALAANTSGQRNTATGYLALGLNNTGGYNSAYGMYALYNNLGASNNTALGYGTLYTNSVGTDNTAIGLSALNTTVGYYNTAVGSSAGYNATGSNLALFGYKAGNAITSGAANTFIGTQAGFGNASANATTTGSNNTYIGFQTVGSANNNTNEIVIGHTAVGNGSNTTTIGNSSTTNTVIPAGNVTLTNGNVVQGTAAKGFNFTANTPAAGKTSQLLNWYEEGTFTPTLNFSGGTAVTYSAQTGYYTRVGNQVTVWVRIAISALSTSSGNVQIDGLPFTAGTGSFGTGVIDALNMTGLTAGGTIMVTTSAANASLYPVVSTTTGRAQLSSTKFTDTSDLRMSVTYKV